MREYTVKVSGQTFAIRHDANPASLNEAFEKVREMAHSDDPVEASAGIQLFEQMTRPAQGIYPYPH